MFLFSLMTLAAVHAEAKTNRMVDPGSGTGGITITGGTDTTNYQYNAPGLTVTHVNGLPLSPESPSEPTESYDSITRKAAKLPDLWFICKTTNDCGLAHVPCNTSLAVNKTHKTKVETAICKGACIDTCAQSAPDTSSAICSIGQCITVIKKFTPSGK